MLSANFRIIAVVSFYFTISLALVFVNKKLMSDSFPYPLFSTWFQLLVQMVFVIVTGFLSKIRVPGFSLFAPLEWDWDIAKSVVPLTLVYIGMISANNICLRYVEVTFYQVARSLTILWTVFFTNRFFPDRPVNKRTLLACLVVLSGFVIGSMGEVHFELKGLIAGVFSSAFVAGYGILIKKKLQIVGDSSWRLLIYNTPLAIIFFIPVLFAADEAVFIKDIQIPQTVWRDLLISGVLGYLINIAIFLQINYTSPLTGAISGTAKACVQTLLGWVVYRNPISTMNGLGIITVISGSAWYSQIRYQGMQQPKKTTEPTDPVKLEEGEIKS